MISLAGSSSGHRLLEAKAKNMDKKFENDLKNTVGYREAENQKSFTVGAQVTFSLLSKTKDEEIKSLKKQVTYWEDAYKAINNDFKTLISIINKYQND
jgi:hypothetical protein